jgi:hypothetical protein
MAAAAVITSDGVEEEEEEGDAQPRKGVPGLITAEDPGPWFVIYLCPVQSLKKKSEKILVFEAHQ